MNWCLSADQLLENERPTAALVPAPRVARWRLHGWHALPHGGSGRLFMAVATPRLTRLVTMPRLGGTPRRVVAARLARQRTPRTAAVP